MTSEKAVAKKEKAHTSQRPKRPELIPVFISIKHLGVLLLPYPPASSPPVDGMLVHRRVTPKQYVTGTHLYTWMKRDKVSKVPCLRKQRDGRGLNPGPPDRGFEVLTTRPHTPPKSGFEGD